MAELIIYIDAALLAPEEFARRSGLTERAVKSRIEKGMIPFVHMKSEGKERGVYMVNNARMIKEALSDD